MTDRKRVAEYVQRFSELIGVPIPPLDQDGFTQVSRGSATVGINVVEEKGFLMFLAPIMEVPANNQEALYRQLLELNYLATEDGAFAIDRQSGRVYLRALRPARVARLRRVRRPARHRGAGRRRVGRQAPRPVRRLARLILVDRAAKLDEPATLRDARDQLVDGGEDRRVACLLVRAERALIVRRAVEKAGDRALLEPTMVLAVARASAGTAR